MKRENKDIGKTMDDSFSILIVEDNPVTRQMLKIDLTKAGNKVVAASFEDTGHIDKLSAEALIRKADKYLYQAKKEGRNRVAEESLDKEYDCEQGSSRTNTISHRFRPLDFTIHRR